MERLIERWKNSQKVKYYIHDNDGVTRSLIEKSKWQIKEVLDVGHALKSIKKNLENFNKREGKPFNGLMESMSRYLNSLFRNTSLSQQKRVELYYNMAEHYIGNHTSCIHDKNAKLRLYTGNNTDLFKNKTLKFLKENDHYAQKINPKLNTQNNECFNRLKTKYLSKNLKYSTSTEMRLSEAVLEWNEDNWEYQLLKKINLENNTYHNDISTRKQTQKKKKRTVKKGKKLLEKKEKLSEMLN